MAEVTCCGVLEFLANEFAWPIFQPMKLGPDTHDMTVEGWNIQLFHRTPSGNVSKKPAPSAAMSYCPFCGAKIGEEE